MTLNSRSKEYVILNPSKHDLPILYSFRRCPYAMRARMAVWISQQKCEIREVQLRNKPPSLLEISPKGTVPVLLVQSGQVVDESLDIIDWALDLHDPNKWQRSKDTPMTQTLININDGEFKFHLDRYKYARRYENEDPQFHREKCLSFIAQINEELANSKYIYDDHISYVDIAIVPFIRQFRIADPHWFDQLPYTHMHSWLHTFLESDLLQSCMKKYKFWQDGDEITLFGHA